MYSLCAILVAVASTSFASNTDSTLPPKLSILPKASVTFTMIKSEHGPMLKVDGQGIVVEAQRFSLSWGNFSGDVIATVDGITLSRKFDGSNQEFHGRRITVSGNGGISVDGPVP